jgi:DNA modification methylase
VHETPDGEQFERWTGVYDPFVGSGTTIIAAEMTGRVCHAIEIDPAYADCGGEALAGLYGRNQQA